ncbi:MAG: DUF3565 domain-containing protein [Candidatus Sericytochromatia bacterium]
MIAAKTALILRFAQDEAGDWIAELDCGHTQHIRHRPPWQDHPWVLEAAERHSRLGTPWECGRCALPGQNLARYLKLKPAQQRDVDLRLCALALPVWEAYCAAHAPLDYVESVVGTHQRVETSLPAETLALLQEPVPDPERLKSLAYRYREPIVALQDLDLEWPEAVEMAYYAMYNALRRHGLGEPVDAEVIVRQVLSLFETDTGAQMFYGVLNQRVLDARREPENKA